MPLFRYNTNINNDNVQTLNAIMITMMTNVCDFFQVGYYYYDHKTSMIIKKNIHKLVGVLSPVICNNNNSNKHVPSFHVDFWVKIM